MQIEWAWDIVLKIEPKSVKFYDAVNFRHNEEYLVS